MRHNRAASIAVLAFAMCTTAQAQDMQNAKSAPPLDTTVCPASIAEIAVCYSTRSDAGAYITAAMPKAWNGNLVVFAHGGPSLLPPNATSSKADLEKYSFAVKRGFAWVASSYRRAGYGVAMAVADTQDARKWFIGHVAKPRLTILHGASYGGLVGAKALESREGGAGFDGAFLNSGAVSGATLNYEHRFDLRMVYQYYCKNLPRAGEPQYPLWQGTAPDSTMTLKDLEATIDECTGASHLAAARSAAQQHNLTEIVSVMGYPENLLFRHMQAATLLFRDIVKNTTGGGNPFGNVDIRYKGSSDDAALNRDVVRYSADPAAAAALKVDGDLTGTLAVPVVSIHSINDPQVMVEAQVSFRDAVKAAGQSNRLVQAFTDERGHTAQSAPEMTASLDALMRWIEKGEKPTPQSIAASCEALRASMEGPCRFHPDFSPPPFSTRFYTREVAVR